jgi:hypothetical protein
LPGAYEHHFRWQTPPWDRWRLAGIQENGPEARPYLGPKARLVPMARPQEGRAFGPIDLKAGETPAVPGGRTPAPWCSRGRR